MINLGDKNWGVKDSGLLAYKQAGSKYFNKDFNFTRASNGTYVDKNGVLQTAELYNLIEYSQDFSKWQNLFSTDTADDAISPNGILNATKLESTTTSHYHLLKSNLIPISSGISYTLSVYVKKGTTDFFQMQMQNVVFTEHYANFDVNNGLVTVESNCNANIENVGNDWYRCSISATAISSGSDAVFISPIPNSTTNRAAIYTDLINVYIYGAQLVEGTEPLDYQYTNGRVGIPRIDFSDGVGALLLEPQRTNLITNSEDVLDYAQNTADITLSTNLSPEGVKNCWRVEGTASGLQVGIATFSAVTGQTFTGSVYVRKISGSDTATIRDIDNNSQTINITTEWQRFSVTKTALSNTGRVYVLVDNIGDIIEVYGFQLEQGSYATSYIKTSGSAVTRIADVANNCGSEQDFNSEEGTLYAEGNFITPEISPGYIYLLSLSDGTSSNRLELRLTGDELQFLWRVGGVYQNNLITIGFNADENFKVALSYSSAKISFWINAVEIGVLNLPTLYAANTLSELAFDDGTGGNNFYGKVRSVKYFPEALGYTKLLTLTGGDGSLQGLFNTFQARVLADGGYIESQDCIINEIKELL